MFDCADIRFSGRADDAAAFLHGRDGVAVAPVDGLPEQAVGAVRQIGAAPLAFNRLVTQPANCLHAGEIGTSWQVGEARLTIPALLHREPR